jgi:UDPglucose 6-dehydrogenase
MSQKKIAIIGTGYVGLVTGICFAAKGFQVVCLDNNAAKIEQLKAGQCPIYEPGLEELLQQVIASGHIEFGCDKAYGINAAKIIFLCLPTPPREDGSADLSYILSVSKEIASMITEPKIVVNKSTVPVGTADMVAKTFLDLTSVPVQIVSNPEFLREGLAVNDFLNPERVIVGSTSREACQEVMDLYNDFVSDKKQIIYMDAKSSEMTKYAANSFLAAKISFINETANLCDKVGANIDYVKLGLGTDPRIGDKFLEPGIGFGGSCFPKDVKALNSTSEQVDYKFEILNAVLKVNKVQKKYFIEKILTHFNRLDLSGLRFAVWGLAFKANTDDIRESPAIEIVDYLLKHGAKINCYDPKAMENLKLYFPDIHADCFDDQYEALVDCDALIILTEWNEFKQADFALIKKNLKQPVIFDGRNLFSSENMRQQSFDYLSIGRS